MPQRASPRSPARSDVSEGSQGAAASKARENAPKSSTPTKGLNNAQDSNALLSATKRGTVQLVLLSLFSRMLTFALNHVLLRLADIKTFGFVSIQLELLLSTVLVLSREGLRLALLRASEGVALHGESTTTDHGRSGDKCNTNTAAPANESKKASKNSEADMEQMLVNMGFLPVPVGVLISLCVYFWHPSGNIAMYGLASVVELLSEPYFLLLRHHMLFTFRVRLEAVALVVKSVVTIVMLYFGLGVLAFTASQVVFAAVLLVGYLAKCALSFPTKLFPRRTSKGNWIDSSLLTLAMTFTKQSLLKHFLTEGDKILLSYLSTDYDQGVYAFVANYGSLFARILFAPLEETSRSYFSKSLALPEPPYAALVDYTRTILRYNVILGIFLVLLGPHFTYFFIETLAGAKWAQSQAVPVLTLYLAYVPVMGVNGILEALLQCIAGPRTVALQNRAMVGCWVAFVGSYAFLYMGVPGLGAAALVLANMVNLAGRIVFAWWQLREIFGEKERLRRVGSGSTTKEAGDMHVTTAFVTWRQILPQRHNGVILGYFVAASGMCYALSTRILALHLPRLPQLGAWLSLGTAASVGGAAVLLWAGAMPELAEKLHNVATRVGVVGKRRGGKPKRKGE